MVILFAVVVAVIVFAIAAFVIGREARRLDAVPPRPVFDINEAVAWVADHLPFEVTAVLSHDDVRRIIDLLGVRDVFLVRERLSELSAVLLSLLGGAELQHYRSVEGPARSRPGPRPAGEPVRSVDVRRQR